MKINEEIPYRESALKKGVRSGMAKVKSAFKDVGHALGRARGTARSRYQPKYAGHARDIDWEYVGKVLIVIGIVAGVGTGIYFLVANYKTIDTRVTVVTWVDDWHSDTDCTTTKVGDSTTTTCDTDYYYRRTFSMSTENGMTFNFNDETQVSYSDYRKNVPEMRTFAVGECVRLGGYDCPWGGFSILNVEKIGC